MLELLRDSPGGRATLHDLADAEGQERAHVRKRAMRLHAAGLVDVVKGDKRGHYTIQITLEGYRAYGARVAAGLLPGVPASAVVGGEP